MSSNVGRPVTMLAGAAVGAYALAGVAVPTLAVVEGAKGGAMVGMVLGPAGAAAGGAAGALVGAACYGIYNLFGRPNARRNGGTLGQSEPPARPVREASVGSQQQRQRERQQRGSSDQEHSGGSGGGDDPEWWKKIKKNVEQLSPFRIFERVLAEILARLRSATKKEAEMLLTILRDALADLLAQHPNSRVIIDRELGRLTLDTPEDCEHISDEFRVLVNRHTHSDLDLGEAADTVEGQTVIYRLRCNVTNRNYVGQAVNDNERLAQHKASVENRDMATTLYRHHAQVCRCPGGRCNFRKAFTVSILMVFAKGTAKRTLDAAEDFWQWLFDALEEYGGIGKQ